MGRILTRSYATGITISYSKALLPLLAHLTNAPTVVYSIRCQVNDSNVVSTTLYLANIHTQVQLANACPVIVMAVPQVACLVTWHTELYWLSTQDSCYCLPSINQWWECNTRRIDTLWLVSHLLTVGGRWTWVSICTSALLPRHGKYPKVTDLCPVKQSKWYENYSVPYQVHNCWHTGQIHQSWEQCFGDVKLVRAAVGTANTTFQHGTSAWRPITALQHDAPLQHFSITLQYGPSALPFSFPVTLALTCAVPYLWPKPWEHRGSTDCFYHKSITNGSTYVFSAPAKHSGGPGFEHNCSHLLTWNV